MHVRNQVKHMLPHGYSELELRAYHHAICPSLYGQKYFLIYERELVLVIPQNWTL